MNPGSERVLEKISQRYSGICGSESALLKSVHERLPFSFRVNTLKARVDETVAKLEKQCIGLMHVPWSSAAFVADKPVSGTPEFANGEIYIQELSSMLPALAMQKEVAKASLVLDACAAPGSKTTQIAAIMDGRGALVANEPSFGRSRALGFNIKKSGACNVRVTNYDVRRFPDASFDAVFVDVPCSGEGTFMDNPKAIPSWSEARIRKLSRLQAGIASRAFSLLAPGGAMLYSTCTFAPEENEMVVDSILRTGAAELLPIKIGSITLSEGAASFGKRSFNPETSKCARVWPHVQKGMGGFFMAKLGKK